MNLFGMISVPKAVDDEGMQQPPREFIKPTIADARKSTEVREAMTFTMTSAGEVYGVLIWNPQLVLPGEGKWEPLSVELLHECFADCDICQVFDPDTQQARMEFQKADAHPLVKAARICFKHGEPWPDLFPSPE